MLLSVAADCHGRAGGLDWEVVGIKARWLPANGLSSNRRHAVRYDPGSACAARVTAVRVGPRSWTAEQGASPLGATG